MLKCLDSYTLILKFKRKINYVNVLKRKCLSILIKYNKITKI